ncbi:hypothetical protein [Streptomyces sp. NPDC058672]|uniref:hypothetical protein n=1 Tax=Streptomyces sp. NPDC058672 TaxID=3346591 RepID=UPI003663C836
MGAIAFFTTAIGTDPMSAFNAARREASWEHGNGGNTGSIAEKDTFKLFDESTRGEEAALARTEELFDRDDSPIADKWGPAGALPITVDSGGAGWLFFGFAPY